MITPAQLAEVERLTAENKRLREALERIATYENAQLTAIVIARCALLGVNELTAIMPLKIDRAE